MDNIYNKPEQKALGLKGYLQTIFKMTKKGEYIFITIDKGDESTVEGDKIANDVANTKGILQDINKRIWKMQHDEKWRFQYLHGNKR